MMNLGINARVILLGTIPAALFAVILAGYAISNVFGVLNDSLHDRGRIIAAQLAPAAEYGVISGNTNILQKLVQLALSNEQDVRTVMVVNNQGEILALSGHEIAPTLLAQIKKNNMKELPQKHSIIFSTPIYRSLVEIEDFYDLYTQGADVGMNNDQSIIGRVYVELGTQTLLGLKRNLITKIAIIGFLGLCLSAFLAWRIGRNITKPIQEIAQAISKVGEGFYAQNINENSSGELRTLQSGFNSMSHSLQRGYEHMQERIHEATQMLRHQAQHDDLTGLINRREFEVRLERCLKSAYANHAQHIFCYLDLDQFKLVNDTCGHVAGDELLKQISTLFTQRIRDRDTFARLGGDEFGLLLENCSLPDANVINNDLLKLVRDFRFMYEDKIFNIGVSIGVVGNNKDFKNTSDIMHAADSACYSAKKAGRNQSYLFTGGNLEVAELHSAAEAIANLTHEMDSGQFELYCQPIVPLSEQVSQRRHFEILIRKIALDGTIIFPIAFIPSAERYHLMPNMDRWVIKNTLAAYRELLDKSREQCDYIFSINLSGTSVSDKSLLGYIREQFSIYAVPPQNICFEITETSAIVNLKNTINLFTALRKIGCSFALDDFGSGMSSFNYLKHFEVDYLKIDGSFVREMHLNPIDHAMVRSIHSVAEAMSIKTVAEFVENAAILKELEAIGVHYGQGYFLGSPQPVKDLIEGFSILNA